MLRAYPRILYRFDQRYRAFHELFNRADMAGWDVLKTTRQKMEDCYSGWTWTGWPWRGAIFWKMGRAAAS